MTINFPDLPKAPEYFTCHYCKEEIKGEYTRETQIQYSCPNHKPLSVDYYWVRMTYQHWIFYRITITLPNQFRLDWLKRKSPPDSDKGFSLLEWIKPKPIIDNDYVGGWRLFNNTYFPSDWILTQSTEKLLSLLKLYTTFS